MFAATDWYFAKWMQTKCDRFGLHKSLRLACKYIRQNRPHLESSNHSVMINPNLTPPVLAKNMTALPSRVPERLQNNSPIVNAHSICLNLERSLQNDIDEGRTWQHDLLSNPWLPYPLSVDPSRNRRCLHRGHFVPRRFCPLI